MNEYERREANKIQKALQMIEDIIGPPVGQVAVPSRPAVPAPTPHRASSGIARSMNGDIVASSETASGGRQDLQITLREGYDGRVTTKTEEHYSNGELIWSETTTDGHLYDNRG